MFVARAENFLHGVSDLDDTIRRLQAYEKAGADVLFAPGLPSLEAIRTVCASVSKPVNVVDRSAADTPSLELEAAGRPPRQRRRRILPRRPERRASAPPKRSSRTGTFEYARGDHEHGER